MPSKNLMISILNIFAHPKSETLITQTGEGKKSVYPPWEAVTLVAQTVGGGRLLTQIVGGERLLTQTVGGSDAAHQDCWR